jgi:outer membrane murein-binding lipoprotein Lpp
MELKMENEDILASIAELKKGSRLSLGMILLGALFLAGSVYYSATRLAPLEQSVRELSEEIAQLEARKTELLRFAAATDRAAKPVLPSDQESDGWVYLGRVSSSGNWAPKSDRVESPKNLDAIIQGSTITTKQNTSLVDNIDIETSKQPDTSIETFIKPGTKLEVLAIREQDSIGNGKLIWVKVHLTSESLLQVGR